MLVHHLRSWENIKTTLFQHLICRVYTQDDVCVKLNDCSIYSNQWYYKVTE